jgi:Na+-transporting NADH:ubiquinone oxidoreductase subunit NqrE
MPKSVIFFEIVYAALGILYPLSSFFNSVNFKITRKYTFRNFHFVTGINKKF